LPFYCGSCSCLRLRSEGGRRAACAACIREHKPHILATQEGLSWQLGHLLSDLDGVYAMVGEGRNRGANLFTDEYSAILYDISCLSVEETGDFMLSMTPDVERSSFPGAFDEKMCSWAVLVGKAQLSGSRLLVASVHLDPYAVDVRARSAEVIVDKVSVLRERYGCEHVYVLGDFNSGPGESPCRTMADAGWRDTYMSVHGPYSQGSFTYHNFRGNKHQPEGEAASDPDLAMDFIWAASSTVSVAAAVIDTRRYGWDGPREGGRYPSDHYPVIVDVLLPAS